MDIKYKVLGLMTCYNRLEKTKCAIASLIEGNPQIDFHFIIWDDGSTDGTYEELKQNREVSVYRGNGDAYYSGGMRRVIDLAKRQSSTFDYALLFNDDVSFKRYCIQKMCQSERNLIIVGPTCDQQGNLSYGGVKRKSKFFPKTEIVKGEYCDTFNANCVLIPWDIFETLDNIDAAYTHSMGDFDYGFQATQKGYKIYAMDEYVGSCDDNCVSGSWRDRNLSRKRRIKLKESPKGLPFKEWFHYLNKNYNLITAVFYSFRPYIRILLKI